MALLAHALGEIERTAEDVAQAFVAFDPPSDVALDASTRVLLQMAKAMLAAKEFGEDQISAVERSLGWERLKALVAETEIAVTNTREDNLIEIVERYPTVRRMIPVLLNAFVFRSWKPNDSLLGVRHG